MLTEFEVELADGRTLHAYDTGRGNAADPLTVFWQHGTPNIGSPSWAIPVVARMRWPAARCCRTAYWAW